MKEMLGKFKSRKFLATVAGIVLGLAMIFGADSGQINDIAGAVTALASIITYILAEAKVDAAAVDKTVVFTTEEEIK